MDDHDSDHEDGEFRVTSPMQPFTVREASIGLVVAAVGLVLTFGVPLALG
jgi:hypothetical protein